MAASGTVSQNLSGDTLTFLDTSTDLPTITSRVLTIFDPNNNLLQTINMGASLTTTYVITQDQWLRFILTLDTGAYTAVVDYVANGFYYNGLINKGKGNCSGCIGGSLCSDTAKAMISEKAAQFYNSYGFAVNADTAIKAADAYIL